MLHTAYGLHHFTAADNSLRKKRYKKPGFPTAEVPEPFLKCSSRTHRPVSHRNYPLRSPAHTTPEALQPFGCISNFSPMSPRQNPRLQHGTGILIAPLSRERKQSRSYHQSQSLIFILFHARYPSASQGQAHPVLPALSVGRRKRLGEEKVF